ncbi:MAG TPA: hypothetical protein VN752_05250 [Solirubrobacterales bacterium]|nr:hypothetical protein [Solirubrobacterales bacterium]
MPTPLPMPLGPGGRLPRAAAGNGGTTAPGRGRRVNPPGQGMMNPPGQDGGRPQRGVGAQGKGQGATNGKGIGVSGAAMPGPGGRQLAARVASGAITQEQADRTMKQRQTLAKALGPDWREKLSVGGQSFAEVNKGLKASPDNAKLAAIRKKLVANRAKVLTAARAKNKGGGKKAPAGEGEE